MVEGARPELVQELPTELDAARLRRLLSEWERAGGEIEIAMIGPLRRAQEGPSLDRARTGGFQVSVRLRSGRATYPLLDATLRPAEVKLLGGLA